jgi:hypothetical protein
MLASSEAAMRWSARPPFRSSRVSCVRVQAKVARKEGEPRLLRGKAFVTRDVRKAIHSAHSLVLLYVCMP